MLLAKSKLNEQNGNHERKMYKQQVDELNKRLENLTQAIEMLKTPNSCLTQKNSIFFLNEIYSKPPKRIYQTNKTDVYHIDDIWNLDILDLKIYNPENNRGYRYVLVVIDNFSKFDSTLSRKIKIAQTIKDSFENLIISSKRKPPFIEGDRDRAFITIFHKTPQVKSISNSFQEIVHMVLFLLKDLIVL